VIGLTSLEPARLVTAAVMLLLFAVLCAAIWRRESNRRRALAHAAEALLPNGDAAPPLLVAYASQTGTAEALAWQTAQALQLGGVAVQVLPLSAVTPQLLATTERALFVLSTYGEGDPPDAAAPFVRSAMVGKSVTTSFAQLHYGVLALGDSTYARFCGFGRMFDEWLAAHGARRLFERIDADRASEAAIDRWRQQLAHLAGTRDAPDWSGPSYSRWVLAARRQLNPGSDGETACHLDLVPADGAPLPDWRAGDLLQLQVPGESQPREYSIASIPADGRVQLLVRQARRADGTPGKASGWLLGTCAVGEALEARIRAHPAFRLGDNARRPLILVGNGTGLAGLRALLKEREAQGREPGRDLRCWLLFGERSAKHDAFYAEDLQRWQNIGLLTRCDLAWSRDGGERRYVQHVLAEHARELVSWVEGGAAIYVCGSLKGMAAGVDAVLDEHLGREALDALTIAGRYRRDVY
jgi:sulfite reductase (NADPH) flavoprotein alpha-component